MRKLLLVFAAILGMSIPGTSLAAAGGPGSVCPIIWEGNWTQVDAWLADGTYVSVYTTDSGPMACQINSSYETCGESGYISDITYYDGPATQFTYDRSKNLAGASASYQGQMRRYYFNSCTGEEFDTAEVETVNVALTWTGQGDVQHYRGSSSSGHGRDRVTCRWDNFYRSQNVTGVLNALPATGGGGLGKYRVSGDGCGFGAG